MKKKNVPIIVGVGAPPPATTAIPRRSTQVPLHSQRLLHTLDLVSINTNPPIVCIINLKSKRLSANNAYN